MLINTLIFPHLPFLIGGWAPKYPMLLGLVKAKWRRLARPLGIAVLCFSSMTYKKAIALSGTLFLMAL